MVRATLEGTARNLRWLLPAVTALSGRETSEIVFGGGAARSPEWAQCLADVLSHPVSVLRDPEVGVARTVGMVALRRHAGDDLEAGPVDVGRRFEPDATAASVHDRLQASFEEAFTAVRGICHSLSP
jgi:xylulokinase